MIGVAIIRVKTHECPIQQSQSIIFFDAFQTEFVLFEWIFVVIAQPASSPLLLL